VENGILHYVHIASLQSIFQQIQQKQENNTNSKRFYSGIKSLKTSPNGYKQRLFTKEIRAIKILSQKNKNHCIENFLLCIGADNDMHLKGKTFHIRDENALSGLISFDLVNEWYIHDNSQKRIQLTAGPRHVKLHLELSSDNKHIAMFFETSSKQQLGTEQNQSFYGAVFVMKFEPSITNPKASEPYQQLKEFSNSASINNVTFLRVLPITNVSVDLTMAPTSLFVTTNRTIFEAELKTSSTLNITNIEAKVDFSTKDGIASQNVVASPLLKRSIPSISRNQMMIENQRQLERSRQGNVFRPNFASTFDASLLVLSDFNLFLYAPRNISGRGSLVEDGPLNVKLDSTLGSAEYRIVRWYNNYLIVVHKKPNSSLDKSLTYFIKIFDLEHKYMVCDQVLKPNIASTVQLTSFNMIDVITCPLASSILIVTKDDSDLESLSVYVLKEKDLDSKLNLLNKKYAYPYAIALSKQCQSINSEVYKASIRTKYGDYLFSKGMLEEAIQQYILTIGHLEPSYIIRKFLDIKKNSYLIQYLYALHIKGYANSDHTGLMLNCFMRLDEEDMDMEEQSDDTLVAAANEEKMDTMNEMDEVLQENLKRLMEYIKEKNKEKVFQLFIDEMNLLNYDADTAIQLFRSKGYRSQSLKLAEAVVAKRINDYSIHNWIIKINMEDFPNGTKKGPDGIARLNLSYEDALKHIESLELPLAAKFMLSYGKVLVSKLERQATNVLIRLCTHYKPIPKSVPIHDRYWNVTHLMVETDRAKRLATINSSLNTDTRNKKNLRNLIKFHVDDPADYIFAFSNKTEWLLIFLEVVTRFHEREYGDHRLNRVMYNTLLELYLINWSRSQSHSPQNHDDSSIKVATAANEQIVEQYTPPNQLNELTQSYAIFPVQEQDLYDSFEKRAWDLLTMDSLSPNETAHYDQEHALVLVQSKKFERGILYLYEKLGLKYDIVQYYIDKNMLDVEKKFKHIYDACLKCVDGHYTNDYNLWVQVLSYFASGHARKLDAGLSKSYLDRVLNEIEARNVLPPLVIVQTLAQQNSETELGTIKKYLTQKLQEEQQNIIKQQHEIEELQRETERLTAEVNELQTSAKIFQLTLCSYCNTELDLPAVHFLCMHSYHQRCLEIEECPKCAKEHREAVEQMERITSRGNSMISSSVNDQSITNQSPKITSGETHDEFFKMLKDSSDGFKRVADMFGTSIFSNQPIDDQYSWDDDSDMML
jgi:hypothetical protein